MFFAPELRHVGAGRFWGADAAKVSQASLPEHADPLPAILDFKKQLDRAGIELLLVPVPPKAVIYPDMIAGAIPLKNVPPRLDAAHQEFYQTLRRAGVDVLDLTPRFLAQRFDAQGPLYCKQDTHWAGRACVLTARLIAAQIVERAWLAGLRSKSQRKFSQQWKRITIAGDLWQALGAGAPPKENVALRFIGTPAKGAKAATSQPVAPDRTSPVILLGDSHNLVFHEGEDMHARGAGLPDQLAYELGFAVDLIAVRGSGATPSRVTLMRRARANPNYLKNKKLVIWCFSAREFTESSGWQKVPVVK